MIEHDSNNPISRGWSFDRKINIYGTVGLMLAMATWVWNIQNDVSTNARDIQADKALTALQIININDKLDNIIEHQSHPVSAQRFADIQTQLFRIEDKVDRHNESAKHTN